MGHMKPQLAVITLGVDNLEVSVHFYKNILGFDTKGIEGQEFVQGSVAFINLQSGIQLALRPRKSLADDIGLIARAPSPTDVTLGHYVHSRAEVDAILEKLFNSETAVRFGNENVWGGYSGYFQDPDGHLWEVTCRQ